MSSRNRSSSVSEEYERYEMMDEKKRRRMISNRESARRSRMKRENHMKDLTNHIIVGNKTRKEFIQKINEVTQQYLAVESENMILRAQCEELRKRLETAEMVSGYMCWKIGYSMDIPQAQDTWLKPWQPIMTSAGISQF